MDSLRIEVLKTLAYYDIWNYPLTETELFRFLHRNTLSFPDFQKGLKELVGSEIQTSDGYYFILRSARDVVRERYAKERHAKKLWRVAHVSMHIIKRFPFVRGICVSGDLSKNATTRSSDIDFAIFTTPGRLWIARWMLILFKKAFLLNRKKFFCLNYFLTTDRLEVEDQNLYVATEIAHLKPLYNSELFLEYINANAWIRKFFPNFAIERDIIDRVNNRRSVLQRALEISFSLLPEDRIDTFLMRTMQRIWVTRYPTIDAKTREQIFRSTKYESRAYPGNFQEKILHAYKERIDALGLDATVRTDR